MRKLKLAATRGFGENPTLFIHEILHLFGIDDDYKTYYWDIMRPIDYGEDSCDIRMKEEDISCLKYIYSNGQFEGNCSEVDFID